MEGGRSQRRISSSRESRLTLLAKIKDAKDRGERLRIEKSEDPVYETVEESEYADIVRKRLEDDWIIDDDGLGYAEDGREIFDDNDEDIDKADHRTKKSKQSNNSPASKRKRLNPDIRPSVVSLLPSVGRDIRSLFAASSTQTTSRKKKDVTTDPNLDDLLAELESSVSEHRGPGSNHLSEKKYTSNRTKPTHPDSHSYTQNVTNQISRPQSHLSHQRECPSVRYEDGNTSSSNQLSKPNHMLQNLNKVTSSKNPFATGVLDGGSSPKCSTIVTTKREFNGNDCRPTSVRNEGITHHKVQLDMKSITDDVVLENGAGGDAIDDGDDGMNQVITDHLNSNTLITQSSFKSEWDTDEFNVESTADWLAAENLVQMSEVKDSSTDYPFNGTNESDGKLFYWFDAYEDVKTLPGVVYLFGKVYDHTSSNHRSCCLRIKDLERRVFLLPRTETLIDAKPVTVKEVYMEFRDLSSRFKIGKFRCKTSTKRYAFEFADVPEESDYLEVRYSASCPALPSDLHGDTFSHIFGTNTSFLENLILDLQLRGPCWLQIQNATQIKPQISWCYFDYEVMWHSGTNCPINKLSSVIEQQQFKSSVNAIPPAPPFCVIALNVKSVVQSHSSHSEIISIGFLIDNTYLPDRPVEKGLFQAHYLVLAPPKDAALPYDLRTKMPTFGSQYCQPSSNYCSTITNVDNRQNVNIHHSKCGSKHSGQFDNNFGSGIDIESNERALLGRFLTRLHKLDPDLIIGHDLWGNQIELLIQRLHANKVPHWHRIGRLRRSLNFPINLTQRSWLIRHALPGRLICDTRISARELIRSRTYNLTDLANQVLSGIVVKTKSNSLPPKRQVPQVLLNRIHGRHSHNMTNGNQQSDCITELGLEIADLEIDSADLRFMFDNSNLVRQLIDFCLSDAHLVLRLAHQLQIIPLAMQITSICGNVLSRTLSGGRAERNESLLLHAFDQQGYIVPDPPQSKRATRTGGQQQHQLSEWDTLHETNEDQPTGRRKPAYTGGLVLEPKRGFYDKYILLLDFNSLYPSIIQEFNICFTSVDRELVTGKSSLTNEDDNADQSVHANNLDDLVTTLLAIVHGQSDNPSLASTMGTGVKKLRIPTAQVAGILPAEIRRLVESRREVKKLLAANTSADSAQIAQWNTRQAALKLTANSVYGCLGFAASRFCARGLAALVTGLGRAVLMNTRDVVERMNMEVIYGDTDSIMINTNSTDLLTALAIGEKIRHEVNKHYRLLELDTDGVYAAMLLLAKKKYAALAIRNPIQWSLRAKQCASQNLAAPQFDTKQEMKGLDIVRRDWSAVAIAVGRRCVAALLSGDTKDNILDRIHSDLIDTAEKVRQGKLPISDYIITKMLTKNPEDYTDVKSQPHVQVALRLNANCGTQDSNNQTPIGGGSRRRIRAGDTIEYIICEDGSNQVPTQRAYSPSELNNFLLRKTKSQPDSQTVERDLKIDVQYYLAHQIHPVVSRLVAPIEGTSPAQIADCLGLDASSYRRHCTAANILDDDEHNPDSGTIGGFSSLSANCWGDVDPLLIDCPKKCNGPGISIKTCAYNTNGKSWSCPVCGHNLLLNPESTRIAVNQLVFNTRQLITRYELGWQTCEDPACGLVTRNLLCPPNSSTITGGYNAYESCGMWARGGRPLCPACGGQAILKLNYSESKLYRQLCFFRFLVSTPSNSGATVAGDNFNVVLSSEVSRLLQRCRSYFDNLLSHSAYAMVDLRKLFTGLRTNLPRVKS